MADARKLCRTGLDQANRCGGEPAGLAKSGFTLSQNIHLGTVGPRGRNRSPALSLSLLGYLAPVARCSRLVWRLSTPPGLSSASSPLGPAPQRESLMNGPAAGRHAGADSRLRALFAAGLSGRSRLRRGSPRSRATRLLGLWKQRHAGSCLCGNRAAGGAAGKSPMSFPLLGASHGGGGLGERGGTERSGIECEGHPSLPRALRRRGTWKIDGN